MYKKPNVLIMIDTEIKGIVPSPIGGPGKGLFQFIEHSGHEDFNYCLCTFSYNGRLCEFINQARSRAYNLEVLTQHATYDPSLIYQAYRLIRKKGFNILQSHGYKGNLICLFLKNLMHLPWITFVHGWTDENFKIRIYNKVDTWLLKFSDRVVVVSNSLKNKMLHNRIPEHKIDIIYNAIDPDGMKPKIDPESINKTYGIEKNDFIIGVIGRLSPEKGHAIFLKAFKDIASIFPHVKVLIIGDGQERKRLKEFCMANGLNHRVIFTGHQGGIANFYQLIDLLVLPSLSEGLPNVVLEAGVFKIPIIATKVGGVPEVINNGHNGILVSPNNPVELKMAIKSLLLNKDKSKIMGENGYTSLFPQFSPTIRAKKIVYLYKMFTKNNNN